MSPENASAVSAAEETVPATPESSTPVLSRELIEEARKNRDPSAVNAAIEAAMNPQAPTPPAETPAPESQEAPVSEQPSDENSGSDGKIFTINYQGEKVEIPDDDSYLGHGSFGKLKKTYAHQKKTLEGYEERVRNARAEADRAAAEKSELQLKYDEAQQKLAAAQSAPPRAEQPPAQQTQDSPAPPAQPVQNVAMPTPPEYPDLPLEPESWGSEDAVRFKDYQTSRAKYDKQVAEVMQKIATRPAGQAQGNFQNDPALVKQVGEMSEYIRNLKQNEQRVQNEQKLKGFWDGLRDFQNLHNEELSTPEDLKATHDKIQNWMDGVAWANGVQLPANADKIQKQQYYAAKKVVVDKYLKNDPTILANSEGTPPPNGFKNYFKIAGYQEKKNDLINKGVLGPNATLQDAWKHLYSEKEISEDINALEASARAEGSQAVLGNLQNNQRQNAITIPNSVATNAQESEAPIRINEDEARQILASSPNQLLGDPELKRKFDYLVANVKPR